MGNVGIEGIAYHDVKFKTGIPGGLLTFPFSLQKGLKITFSLKYFQPLILAHIGARRGGTVPCPPLPLAL